MTIKFLLSISGGADPANGFERDFSFGPGAVAEVADSIGAKWVASGIATSVAGTQAPIPAKPAQKKG